jgi:beta-ureidopropionase
MTDQCPLRVALTETSNAYSPMPRRVEDLTQLEGKLDAVREANVRHHVKLIGQAAEAGARVVGLGELFSAPYFALGKLGDREIRLWQSMAEDAAKGPTVVELCAAAREHAVILVAPIYELDSESGKRFNTAVLIDEKGQVLGKYRKNHIPAGSNEQGNFQETLFYGPGDGALGNPSEFNRSGSEHFPVFQTSCGRIGIAICYDRHFPGVMQTLADNGAQLVFVPAVTFGEHSRKMWDLEFPVDAARHRLFIAGSNRSGSEAPWNQEYFGASCFAGPTGRVPALSSPKNLVIADLDLGSLDGPCSSGWDLKRDLRPSIYG